MELVTIQKYLYEFHDGSLFGIEHVAGDYILSLESAEMDRSDMKDNIPLSERGTIRGRLHLENTYFIKINERVLQEELKLQYDYGTIFDFEIRNKEIELQIVWENVPQKPDVNDFSTIVIRAKKIWWENIPDLYDPFW